MPRSDERRSARSKVLLKGTIDYESLRVTIRIVNLSDHGALVTGDTVPGEDTAVIFRCSGLETKGWIAWISPPHAGINFDEPVDAKSILPTSPSAANLITKDTRKLDFRRPGFRGDQLTPEERLIVDAWKSSNNRNQ